MGPDVMIDKSNGLIRIGNMAPFSVRRGDIYGHTFTSLENVGMLLMQVIRERESLKVPTL